MRMEGLDLEIYDEFHLLDYKRTDLRGSVSISLDMSMADFPYSIHRQVYYHKTNHYFLEVYYKEENYTTFWIKVHGTPKTLTRDSKQEVKQLFESLKAQYDIIQWKGQLKFRYLGLFRSLKYKRMLEEFPPNATEQQNKIQQIKRYFDNNMFDLTTTYFQETQKPDAVKTVINALAKEGISLPLERVTEKQVVPLNIDEKGRPVYETEICILGEVTIRVKAIYRSKWSYVIEKAGAFT